MGGRVDNGGGYGVMWWLSERGWLCECDVGAVHHCCISSKCKQSLVNEKKRERKKKVHYLGLETSPV